MKKKDIETDSNAKHVTYSCIYDCMIVLLQRREVLSGSPGEGNMDWQAIVNKVDVNILSLFSTTEMVWFTICNFVFPLKNKLTIV